MPLTISDVTGIFQGMKKREDDMPVNIEPVRLKPFLGMQPGVYLTILYALILLTVVFLVAILPGIIKSGKRVTFTSAVAPSYVTVDGRYMGSTPVTAFLEPGQYTAVYAFEDIASTEISFKVGHPVFLTWLFPRNQTINANSFIDDIPTFRKYLDAIYDQIVAWSAITEFDDHYHRPPLFTQVAQTVEHVDLTDYKPVLEEFLLSSFVHVTSAEMLDDVSTAVSMLKESNTFESDTLNATLSQVKTLFSEDSPPLVGEKSKPIAPAPQQTTLQAATLSIPGFSYPRTTFVKGAQVPQSFPEIQQLGITETVEPFSISALEISEYQWALFIKDNPYWAKANIKTLIADNVVDSQYLAGVYPTTAIVSNKPIKNISWYAAQAFTEWLSQTSDTQVFLPSEGQWELAAASVADKGYSTSTGTITHSDGPSAMLGGLWEFTNTPYEPLSRYLNLESTWVTSSTDFVVKGGAYINDPTTITRQTVGVMAREACTEFTGFRIAWKD